MFLENAYDQEFDASTQTWKTRNVVYSGLLSDDKFAEEKKAENEQQDERFEPDFIRENITEMYSNPAYGIAEEDEIEERYGHLAYKECTSEPMKDADSPMLQDEMEERYGHLVYKECTSEPMNDADSPMLQDEIEEQYGHLAYKECTSEPQTQTLDKL
jgi:hypothetical protein